VLDEHVVFEDADLDPVATLTNHHRPLDGLPARQELGLAEDRHPAAAGVAPVPTALTLGLQAGRTADALHSVAVGVVGPLPRSPDLDDRVRRVRLVVRGGVVARPAATATATATARGSGLVVGLVGALARLLGARVGVVGLVGVVVLGIGVRIGLGAVALATTPATTPAATAATPAARTALAGIVVRLVVVEVGRAGGLVGRRLVGHGIEWLRCGGLGRGAAGLTTAAGAADRLVRSGLVGGGLVGGLGGGLGRGTAPAAPDGRLEDGRGRREQGRQHGGLVGRVRGLDDARLLIGGQDLLRRRRGRCGQLRHQHDRDLLRRLAVHAGLDAAGGEPQVQQRGHHLPARAPEKLRQRVHPQLLGQVVEAG
jgi:hypothetical protein